MSLDEGSLLLADENSAAGESDADSIASSAYGGGYNDEVDRVDLTGLAGPSSLRDKFGLPFRAITQLKKMQVKTALKAAADAPPPPPPPQLSPKQPKPSDASFECAGSKVELSPRGFSSPRALKADEREDLKAKLTELTTRLEEATKRSAEEEKKKEAMIKMMFHNSSVAKKNEEKIAKLDEAIIERDNALLEKTSQYEDEKRRLDSHVSLLEKKVAQLQGDGNVSTTVAEAPSNMISAVQRKKNADLQKQLTAMQIEAAKYRSLLKKAEDSAFEKDSLLAQENAESASASQEEKAMNEKLITDLNKEKEELEAQKGILLGQVAQAKSAEKKLRHAHTADAKAHEERLAKTKSTLNAATSEIAVLEEKLRATTDDLNSKFSLTVSLKEEVGRIAKDAEAKSTLTKEQKLQLEQLGEEVYGLRGDLQSKEDALSRVLEEIKDKDNELQKKRDNILHLQGQCIKPDEAPSRGHDETKAVADLNSKVRVLELQLRQSEAEKSKLLTFVNKVREEKTAAEQNAAPAPEPLVEEVVKVEYREDPEAAGKAKELCSSIMQWVIRTSTTLNPHLTDPLDLPDPEEDENVMAHLATILEAITGMCELLLAKPGGSKKATVMSRITDYTGNPVPPFMARMMMWQKKLHSQWEARKEAVMVEERLKLERVILNQGRLVGEDDNAAETFLPFGSKSTSALVHTNQKPNFSKNYKFHRVDPEMNMSAETHYHPQDTQQQLFATTSPRATSPKWSRAAQCPLCGVQRERSPPTINGSQNQQRADSAQGQGVAHVKAGQGSSVRQTSDWLLPQGVKSLQASIDAAQVAAAGVPQIPALDVVKGRTADKQDKPRPHQADHTLNKSHVNTIPYKWQRSEKKPDSELYVAREPIKKQSVPDPVRRASSPSREAAKKMAELQRSSALRCIVEAQEEVTQRNKLAGFSLAEEQRKMVRSVSQTNAGKGKSVRGLPPLADISMRDVDMMLSSIEKHRTLTTM